MSERRPFHRPMRANWWMHRPYLGYTIRELSGVAVALYGGVLLVGVICLEQGADSYEAYRQALASPGSVLLHLGLLIAVVWHVITWFQTLPKTMPKLVVGGKAVPQHRMTAAALSVAILCSAALLALAIGSAI